MRNHANSPGVKGHGFGTSPVFLAAICTILGAILFLRFGFAVGNVGVLGALVIILIGHAITIPTGLAVAEIATNLKVEGGGEYNIISRSFGSVVGGAIGISLYLSQAISIAFYMIAFSEAFRPLFGLLYEATGVMPDLRFIGVPFTLLLVLLMLTKGANMGVKVLWVVAAILAVSLALFFMGKPIAPNLEFKLMARTAQSQDFALVFAIVFPAFTGMTAGVGLSGDLKNPRRSIPIGTIAATLIGMVIYIMVVIKLGLSATPEQLAGDSLIMSRIALWGPIIFIGLGAASISSALGSILVAPRTLQALAGDAIFPSERLNRFLGKGVGQANEPVNATLVTSAIALTFVSMGNIDFVAQIISMFFMVTYGALCTISFLEHFAGNPSYRPTFRSRWYFSLLGAVACMVMMFWMDVLYAILALVFMGGTYAWLKHNAREERNLSTMIQGVFLQLTRKLQILLQKRQERGASISWRPSFIAISSQSLTRLAPFDLLRWISHHYGFGTFIHFIKGPLQRELNERSRETLTRLVQQTQASRAGIYVDTIISPSFMTAVAQIVQIPGISGQDNNSILFEFREGEDTALAEIINSCQFAAAVEFNICLLHSSERHFGYKHKIHIWLTHGDYRNANLMILLAYILMGHPEWKGCEVRLYAAFEEKKLEEGIRRLNELIAQGRIPISTKNVRRVPFKVDLELHKLIKEYSEDADLVITGLSLSKMQQDGGAFIKGFAQNNDILFVRAGQPILITDSLGEQSEQRVDLAGAEQQAEGQEPEPRQESEAG